MLRSVLELRPSVTRLPAALLRFHGDSSWGCRPQTVGRHAQANTRAFNTTTPFIEPSPDAPTTQTIKLPHVGAQDSASDSTSIELAQRKPARPLARRHNLTTTGPLPPPPPISTKGPIPPSVRALLPLLRAQPSHYIRVHIHRQPYLATVGDSIRLPFLLPGVLPGDVLRLNRATLLGSRDYTLKGSPHVDERLFECRAVVLGTETEPLRVMVKRKRRNRKRKTVRSKHRYTVLRIKEIVIMDPEEIEPTTPAARGAEGNATSS